jgi:hypothetical protein
VIEIQTKLGLGLFKKINKNSYKIFKKKNLAKKKD